MIKNLLISSANKNYGTSTNYYITLDEPLYNIQSVKLLHTRIPVSWYNITSANNIILFNEGSGNLIATLTKGNYNITELIIEIKNKMDLIGVNTYTVSYDKITMKLTISSTGSYILSFASSISTIWNMLGYNNVNTISNISHTSDNIIDLISVKYIQIVIPEIGIIGRSTNTNNEYTFLVPVNEDKASIIQFNENNTFNQIQYNIHNKKDIQNLHIIIKDQDNNILDLNNSDTYLLIECNY